MVYIYMLLGNYFLESFNCVSKAIQTYIYEHEMRIMANAKNTLIGCDGDVRTFGQNNFNNQINKCTFDTIYVDIHITYHHLCCAVAILNSLRSISAGHTDEYTKCQFHIIFTHKSR